MQTARNRLGAGPARGNSAFTLIELLVVIGIIGILAALLMPAMLAALDKAHQTATLNLIHQCEVAAQSFFADYGDYPPSHWHELDEFFEYDSNDSSGTGFPDGVYNRAHDEVFFEAPPTFGPVTYPSTVNEGIEVFLACLATRTGGPYLELSDKQIANTDVHADGTADTVGSVIAQNITNWYFGGQDTDGNGIPDTWSTFEIVDWWGNPLVYFHSRDYARYDGYDELNDVFYDPGLGPDEAVTYADADGDTGFCYARSRRDLQTLQWPNLDGFQLYSWSTDLLPGCQRPFGLGDYPNDTEPGLYPGWTGDSGNLHNWEE